MRKIITLTLYLLMAFCVPANAFASETAVTVDAGEGFPLEVRLVKPVASEEPVPAVLLVQGSGATDYDE